MSRALSTVHIFLLLAVALIPVGVSAAAEQRVIELAIRGGALPEGQRVIRVQQGQEVILRWTADRALTIHLHGYDIEKKVAPQAPATMQFPARATGRFPIEIHGPGHGEEKTIGYLEVHPR